VAYLRGNRDIGADLTFYRIEPYVIPKKSLTGDSTERVDTRVLQVLYTFEPGEKPIYVGQQMDVFIETPPLVLKD
jgi:HlyD family secretion protein